jgi:predicted AAA+ superfamily ATPase
VEHWEKFVRRLADQENCRIYLTGSSSKLLSRELATSLRGRTLPYEVFPLSFGEFLQFNHIEANPHSSRGQALLLHWLRRYLRQGGFPELVFLPEALHRRIVDEYLDLMLYRDLAERFSIKNPALLKYLLKYLLGNMANPISITKVYHDLKSQGYAVGKNTVFEYISYLEEAYVLFRVDIWSRSVRAQAVNPSKVYAIDPAFKYAMSITEDTGRVFENAVFLALRRQGHILNYYLDGQEVDFFWEKGQLINASYMLTDAVTRQRETDGLFAVMQRLDLSESRLITWEEQREIQRDGRKIIVQPLWEFLLS